MRILWLTVSLLSLMLVLVSRLPALARGEPAANPIPMYEVQFLGYLPGESNSIAQGVNEAGDVVGWSGYPEQAFLWRQSTGMVRLEPIPGYTRCHARDINNLGEVAGTCGWDLSDEPSRAARWLADGTPQNLGSLYNGRYSHGYGINDLGNVVGASATSRTNTITYHAFIYTDEDGLIDITPGAGGVVYGYDINDVGPIGEATGSGSSAFRWRNGTLEWLPDLPDFPFTYAFAINDNSQVAGTAHSSTGNAERSIRWTDGSGWEILGGAGEDNKSWGINDAGTVVGRGRPNGGIERAFIYENSVGMRDLNDFIATPGWLILWANDINNAGVIVGHGTHSSGLTGAVRLVPLTGPTPTATPTTGGSTATPPPATPSASATLPAPTITPTSGPPSATATAAPPTATMVPATATSVPPTATAVPGTATVTGTAVPPTATGTALPPSVTPSGTASPPAGTPTTTPQATETPGETLYIPLVRRD